jgi:multiple sugar transport system substrate-binding protein
MPTRISRRDFLAGVLATGILSAGATALVPGGRTVPPVTLRMVTGEDPTGARDLLLDLWHQRNPRISVRAEVLRGSTEDQRRTMESRAKSGAADILNLDIIHIPRFRSQGLIEQVEIANVDEFLERPLTPGAVVGAGSAAFWAVPFNSDVGMLFERVGKALPGATDLAGVVDGLPDGSAGFAGQLRSESTITEEAFTVNVLEHALSRDPDILDPDTGHPARELERWVRALGPMHVARARGRLTVCDGEAETTDQYRALQLPYMRNWPVKYRTLQMQDDGDARAATMAVRALPQGVLGGQSLALVTGSDHHSEAMEFIRFLTGLSAQKIIAAYGLAPVHREVYNDPALLPFVPHLDLIRGAIERAVPRPVHPDYGAASRVFFKYVGGLPKNSEDVELTTAFVDELQAALPMEGYA